jgi:hypothetical protein
MNHTHGFSRDVLRAATLELTKAGFEVSSGTPDLLADGIALTAYRAHDDFGALVAFPELGQIVRYGAVYLWAGSLDSKPKPFGQRDIRSRLESYIAKICLDVASTPAGQGIRQQTLSRAAYKIGGLAAGHDLDSEPFKTQLEEAGLASGLEPHRVRATVQAGLRAGTRNPQELENRPAPNHLMQNTTTLNGLLSETAYLAFDAINNSSQGSTASNAESWDTPTDSGWF